MGVESDKRPFSRINVVECGDGVSAAFGAKMLADLGANVVKVEPPGGDSTRRRGPFPGDKPEPDKSGLYIYLNANKRGVTADLTRREGRDLLDKLLERADVLIHNVHPRDRERFGLNSPALCAQYPKLIVTSISMFGDTGPRADWRAYELNVANAGGWAYLSPGTSDRPDLPPLKAFGAQCDFQGGVYAAMADARRVPQSHEIGQRTGDQRVRAGMHCGDGRAKHYATTPTRGGKPRGSVSALRPVVHDGLLRRQDLSHAVSRRISGNASLNSWAIRNGPKRKSSKTGSRAEGILTHCCR